MKLILIILITALSFWSLISEKNRIGFKQWVAFAGLRSVAIILFALVLWGVPLGLNIFTKQENNIALVVDASRSMAQRDGGPTSRFDRAMDLLGKIPSQQSIKIYIYDKNGLSEAEPGTPVEHSDNTDLIKMINAAVSLKPKAVVLFSDGNHNAAGNPPVEFSGGDVPIYTIGIGPEADNQYPSISRINSPEEISPGQKASIELQLDNVKDKGKIVLIDNRGRTLQQAEYSSGKKTITLEATTSALGLSRYTVNMLSGGDTIDRKNVVINVKKDRITVLYLSGNPGWDLRFMLQAAANAKNIEIDPYLWKNNSWAGIGNQEQNQQYLGDKIKTADVIILQDIKGNILDSGLEGDIAARVQNGGCGLLIMGLDWLWAFRSRQLYAIAPIMPSSNSGSTEGTISLTKYFLTSAMFDQSMTEQIAKRIVKYPPLNIRGKVKQLATDAVLLGSIENKKENIPFLGRRYFGRGRVMQITASSLWPWKMTAQGILGDSLIYSALITGSFHWLAGMEDQNITLSTDRSFYYPNEKIIFQGTMPAENSRAQGLEWSVEIRGRNGVRQKRRMSHWGSGRYIFDAGTMPPGEYSYESLLSSDGKKLTELSGRFWVEPFTYQEKERFQNRELLREISRVTQGRYWDIDSLAGNNDWLDQVKPQPAAGEKTQAPWLFLLIMALLLAGEWYWRRRSGLS
ncbi:MAG: VWA domain-containing protein [Candidatus Edwardsbacteria bacterium]|nr:VWA domain-containing protein [Candidatus Edwardsbacteria bacterium]MBU1576888.1 VWA domain-containing protein [Candidatus Edwardsbacteria bacterium]MBU2463690.1 VWA domain-containing protein [Candidatus Edwardsbacteria bacterium]MBU2594249.1 VWA domain-containing protein [Candidatus Edwardsbacteria bacterium]